MIGLGSLLQHSLLKGGGRSLLALQAPGLLGQARVFAAQSGASSSHQAPRTRQGKEELVEALLAAKAASGKTFSEIAAATGLTNAYVAQLFFNQAQLKPGSAEKMQSAVPGLSPDLVAAMMRPPMRSFDPDLIQEPLVYRLYEAVMHYGEGLKSVVNEEFGDGIMSAIDFYVTVDKIKGAGKEDRVCITFNGKFLPHVEQLSELNTAAGNSKKKK